MRSRGILLVMALLLSASLLFLLGGQPASLAAQDSPLASDSPLVAAPVATDTPRPSPTVTKTPTATPTDLATTAPTTAALAISNTAVSYTHLTLPTSDLV